MILLSLLLIMTITSCGSLSEEGKTTGTLKSPMKLALQYETLVDGLEFELIYKPDEDLYMNVDNHSAFCCTMSSEAKLFKMDSNGNWIDCYLEPETAENGAPGSAVVGTAIGIDPETRREECCRFFCINRSLESGQYMVVIEDGISTYDFGSGALVQKALPYRFYFAL